MSGLSPSRRHALFLQGATIVRQAGRAALRLVTAWLLCAVPAHAAITYLASNTVASSGATNSVTVTKPAGVTAGDVMLALIAQRGGNFPLGSNMISVPSGWTVVLNRDGATQ